MPIVKTPKFDRRLDNLILQEYISHKPQMQHLTYNYVMIL